MSSVGGSDLLATVRTRLDDALKSSHYEIIDLSLRREGVAHCRVEVGSQLCFAKVYLASAVPQRSPRILPSRVLGATKQLPLRSAAELVERELRAVRFLENVKLPLSVPEIVCSSHLSIVYRYVDARSALSILRSRSADPARSLEYLFANAGASLQLIHSLGVPGRQREYNSEAYEGPDWADVMSHLPSSTPSYLRRRLFDLLSDPQLPALGPGTLGPAVWTHGDVSLDNLLASVDGQVHQGWLIDFEHSAVRPALYDLVCLSLNMRFLSMRPRSGLRSHEATRLLDAFWSAYGAPRRGVDSLRLLTDKVAQLSLYLSFMPEMERRGVPVPLRSAGASALTWWARRLSPESQRAQN